MSTTQLSGAKPAAENRRDGRAALGQDPIGSLLVKLSVPGIVAMAVNGLYNLVDTIFIGRGVGTEAIGGLALAFPAQMIVMAFGMSIGQGAASIVSRALGAGNDSQARRAAGNAFALALVLGLLTLVLGTLFLEPLLNLLGAEGSMRIHAASYLRVILIGSPFIAMAMVSNNLLRAEGKASVSMTVMLIGAITNIILDPVYIFVFHMGVGGAAWATVTGQFLSFLYASRFFLLKRSLIQIAPKHWIPKAQVLREITLLGIPAFIRQSGQSLVFILVNNLLGIYGSALYIAAYGVINRLIMFLFMPLFGLIQGFQPIAGFNYGAQSYNRVLKTVNITLVAATLYTTTGFVFLMLFPRFIAGIFSSDAALLDTVTIVIRYVVIFFPLVGMQIVGGTYFLVIGKAVPSLILNLSRQFLLLLPLLLILPPILGLQGLLLTFPIADALSAVITGLWFFLELRHLRKKAKEV